jgi:RimJ/RimL family protein N-acetyltransferase
VIAKITNKIRRLSIYYEKQGLWGLFKHIFTNLVHYNKWIIFEGDVSAEHVVAEAKIPVTIRLVSQSEEDIDKLAELWPEDYAPPFSTPQNVRELIAGLLRDGEKCMVAEYRGEIIHMNWMGFHDTHRYHPYEIKRKLKPNEVLSYYSYCSVKYRGNSLMGAVRSKILDYLVEHNYKKIISYVMPGNTASIKVNTRFLGKPALLVRFWSILGFNFSLLSRKRS